jgi:hypothetical protein
MKPEWIEIVRRKKRLKLTFFEYILHYIIVIFLLVIPVATLVDLFNIFITGNYHGSRSVVELISVSIPTFVLAIALAYLQYRRLRLKEIKIFYTPEQFQEAVRRTAKELNWIIVYNQNDFFFADSIGHWSLSGGLLITIIKESDGILINCRHDPLFGSPIFSNRRYKRNIKTFLKNLDETIRDIPEKPLSAEAAAEKELFIEKIIVRIVAYSICLFLICISLYIMMNLLTFASLIIGLIVICLATTYLFYDLKIIFTKNKK